MMKHLPKLAVFLGLFLAIFTYTALADVVFPTTTTVYFQKDGEPYENRVDYTVNCYGYNWADMWWEGGSEVPEDYDPDNPELVFTYNASCPEYGCEVYEDYYLNYRTINYCDLEGQTEGKNFIIANYANTPVPPDCEEVEGEFERTCIAYFEIPELQDIEKPFLDVPINHENLVAIDYVKNEGIVHGYPDETYKPDNSINRAEFTKIIIESTFNEEEINECVPTKTFPDVPENEWYSKYVCTASNWEIIHGYPDGTFKPADTINFVEAAKIIVTAFEYETVPSDIWYVPFVQILEETNAIPTTITVLDEMITRGEMAEIIYRFKEDIRDLDSATLL